ANHFRVLRDLNKQRKDAEWSSRFAYEETEIERAEREDKRKLNWRLYVLLTFMLSSWITGFELAINTFDAAPKCYLAFWLFVSFQISLFLVYMVAWIVSDFQALYGFGVLPPGDGDPSGPKTDSTSLREWLAQRPLLLNRVMLALLVLSVLTVGYVAKFHCT
ncbi:MAG: hypothetical protein U9Q81_00850, partial [Pseudomonadota bacterium]|nr:hypothetical protein [Pseudomonadota bacterium]